MKRLCLLAICIFLLSFSPGYASSVNYVGDSIDPAADETVTGFWIFQNKVLIEKTDTEALLVRKDADGGDIFVVDTTNGVAAFGGVTPVSGTRIILPMENDAATPTFAFSDGDTGLYESAVNILAISVEGTARWFFSGDDLKAMSASACMIRNVAASTTVPNLIPDRSDLNTGIGQAGADMLSLIAGAEEGVRLVQDTWGCSLHIPEITTPTAIADWAALYAKSNNELYFQDGAGVEHVVSLAGDAYGEMYVATTQTQSIAASATWYEVGTFTTGIVNGVTFGSDRLTAPFDGDYEIEWTASTSSAAANRTFSIGVGVNGADPTTKAIIQRRYSSADVGASAGEVIVALTAGQYINLMVRGDTDTTNIDFNFGNLELHKM